jgi:hypothetical protein
MNMAFGLDSSAHRRTWLRYVLGLEGNKIKERCVDSGERYWQSSNRRIKASRYQTHNTFPT